MLGGKVIKIRNGESTGINPFDIEPEENGKTEYININDKVAEILDLMATICRHKTSRKLDGVESAEIEKVVKMLYAERDINEDVSSLYEKKGGKLDNGKYVIGKIQKKMPTLTDFYDKLRQRNKCRELIGMIGQFLKGNMFGMFDCESSVNSNTDIICFDMSEIKDEFTKLYSSFVLLTWIWQKFVLKNRHKKKMIICDEAWLFLKYEESANFLVNVARRGRKYNLALLIGSQFIDEFLRL